MSNKSLGLSDRLYHYLLSVSLREPEILKQLRQETASMPSCNMQIAPEQGQFMALLVQLLGAQKALEIGVFTGYSSLAVALALPPGGKLVACDISEDYTAIGIDAQGRLHLSLPDQSPFCLSSGRVRLL